MNQGKKRSASNDHDVGKVESLLKGMSLSAPSERLDGRIEKLTNPAVSFWNSSWFPTACIALLCMVSGFEIGRTSVAVPTAGPLAKNPTDQAASANLSASEDLSPDQDQSVQGPAGPGNEFSLASGDSASPVRLIDQGLFLLDGQFPVRRFVAWSKSRVKVVDPVTGQQREVDVPVRRSFISHSPGT